MPRYSTYDQWKLASPDDDREPFFDEEFEPELFPVDIDDLEFLMPSHVARVNQAAE